MPRSMLQVCLNGARTASEHPALPLTADQLARDARRAVAAGAETIHLHPRSPDGAESLLAHDVATALGAVRAACPQIPVGVSTGLWITARDVLARTELVRGWIALRPGERPDFASVNLCEPGSDELLRILPDIGIGLEAGVWSTHDAHRLTAAPPPGLVRVLVEVIGVASELAIEESDSILAALGPSSVPVLLHAERAATWPVLRHAVRLGLDTRIGLEDTLAGPDGEPVGTNADLVDLARRIIHPDDRDPQLGDLRR